jgi:dTDP-4-amino-4,6-dideoxygalactose transaminase/nucleoside-diphosphate-sugar epimerase
VEQHVVIGGRGFVGSALVERLARSGARVTVVDRVPPPSGDRPGRVQWIEADLLVDDVEIPAGRVHLVAGASMPRPRRPWTLVLDNALAAARLAPSLVGRDVVVLSSIEVYGAAPAPLREGSASQLPVPVAEISSWCDRALLEARRPCPPWRAYPLCTELTRLDPSGRWVYALSKLAQELLLQQVVDEARLTILRPANILGPRQVRVLTRLAHAALVGRGMRVSRGTARTFVGIDRVVDAIVAPLGGGVFNVGGQQMSLDDLARTVGDELGVDDRIEHFDAGPADSCGVVDDARLCGEIGPDRPLEVQVREIVAAIARDRSPLFVPPLPVVVPPRPEHPDLVADRQQHALWTGVVKHGGPWSLCLQDELADRLKVDASHRLVVTASGTAALRLAILATAGPARPGATALLPSYTFVASGEVLRQLGYAIRFVDVHPDDWTIDPAAVDKTLSREGGDLVVCVDALGNPADYTALRKVCEGHGVPLVADSAPSLGAQYDGMPVGTQADAHAFSMSFAKVVSSGGAGGAVVVPAGADLESGPNWLRSSLLHEVHAVAALDQVHVLDDLVARRQEIAEVYSTAAARWDGVIPQRARSKGGHAYVHWVARFPSGGAADRTVVAAGLERLGVQTKAYYAPVLHRTGLATGAAQRLPVTDRLAAEALALPMSSEMTREDAERVVMAVDRIMLLGHR